MIEAEYEKVTVRRLSALVQAVAETVDLKREILVLKYNAVSTEFDSAFDFFKRLGCLSEGKERLQLTRRFREFLKYYATASDKEKVIRHFIAGELINKCSRQDWKDVDEFLKRFEADGETYTFKPMSHEVMQYRKVRNLMLELWLVRLVEVNERKEYRISEEFVPAISEQRDKSNKVVSPRELEMANKKNKELGERAELVVMGYEKERLSDWPNLVSRIRHVSLFNTAAGYDISSFSVKPVSGEPEEIYIEVKAISPSSNKFYLTRNEIEFAKQKKKNSYLYLLPVLGPMEFDLAGMQKIRDPYSGVCLNSQEWDRVEEVASFSK